MVLYLAFKLITRDYHYWVPAGSTSYVTFSRILVKIVVDFTACAQLRHPNEVGGFYFSFSLLSTVGIGLGSLALYSGDDDKQAVDAELISSIIVYSCAGVAISYFSLLRQIPRNYARTFYSVDTCCDHTCALFELAKGEKPVSEGGISIDHCTDIFLVNEKIWRKAIGDDVKAWLQQKLPTWVDESPSWFSPAIRAALPDWAIDDTSLLEEIRTPEVEEIRLSRMTTSRTLGNILS